MIEVNIPGFHRLRLSHLVLDYNGTLAVDGCLLEGVRERVDALAASLRIHIITGDTFGKAREQLETIDCRLIILPSEGQDVTKADYVQQLGPMQTVAIGNGRNDRLMLQQAEIGIAVLGREGAAIETLTAADLIVPDPLTALDLLRNPLRLMASLRS